MLANQIPTLKNKVKLILSYFYNEYPKISVLYDMTRFPVTCITF